ncbi:hypothetical protein TWF694_005137 [Orbilia ellipsospora]|uniref:F-box domain-containing protein n=1 Tax=Orbilia ellipsospora TaxID=2528407 RepID=A0AAV9WVS9_9PEZI
MSKISTNSVAGSLDEPRMTYGAMQSPQGESSVPRSDGLTMATLRCIPPFLVQPPTPPETPTKEVLEGDTLHMTSIIPIDVLTPPPSPKSEKEESLPNEGSCDPNGSISGDTLADDEEQEQERLKHEKQKAVFLRNAKALREKHYAKIAAKTATKSAREKIAKYIDLSFRWGRPMNFDSWLVSIPETIKFEKREVRTFQKSSMLAVPRSTNRALIQTLTDTLLSKIMANLDFPSAQQLRLVSKRFNEIYNDYREEICDAIAARIPQISYIPDLLLSSGSIRETSEQRLRQKYFCTSWAVQAILSEYRRTAAKYQDMLLEQEIASEIYQAKKFDCPRLQNPRSDLLKGSTYPFPTLIEYLLEKHLGGPRRTRPNLPRLAKKLTSIERSAATDPQESKRALKWIMQLIRWYVAKDMSVYYAINDIITCDADEDVMLSEEEFEEFWRKLEPVQVWELVRLVGIKTETVMRIVTERRFPQYEKMITAGNAEDIKDEFILFRVQEIIDPKEKY